MKLADFFVLRNTCISRGQLCKALCNLIVRKYSFAYRVGLLIFGTACQAILFLLITFVRTFRAKLYSLDLSPFYHVYFT